MSSPPFLVPGDNGSSRGVDQVKIELTLASSGGLRVDTLLSRTPGPSARETQKWDSAAFLQRCGISTRSSEAAEPGSYSRIDMRPETNRIRDGTSDRGRLPPLGHRARALRATDLYSVLRFADRLLTMDGPAATPSVMLEEVAQLVGPDGATLTRIDLRTGHEVVVMWPTEPGRSPPIAGVRKRQRRTSAAAAAGGPGAVGDQPAPGADFLDERRAVREWRRSDAVRDQSSRCPGSDERPAGRAPLQVQAVTLSRYQGVFTDRQLELLRAGRVQLTAAFHRTTRLIRPLLQLTPEAALDRRCDGHPGRGCSSQASGCTSGRCVRSGRKRRTSTGERGQRPDRTSTGDLVPGGARHDRRADRAPPRVDDSHGVQAPEPCLQQDGCTQPYGGRAVVRVLIGRSGDDREEFAAQVRSSILPSTVMTRSLVGEGHQRLCVQSFADVPGGVGDHPWVVRGRWVSGGTATESILPLLG